MKKIYMILAAITLLSMSLNAQQMATKRVAPAYQPAPTEKVDAPFDGIKKAYKPAAIKRAPSRATETNTYTYTLPNSDAFSTSGGTATLGDFTWTYSSFTYKGWENTRGMQIGSRNNPTSTFTLSTSEIPGTITSITVGANAYNANATIRATVGGAAFGTTQNLSSGTSAGTNTFTGSASGEIVITWTNVNNGRAMYFKSIEVTYETEAGDIATLDLFSNTTDANMCLPVYGGFHDHTQHNQMVYPASLLTDMVGKKIKSMTFYPASVTYNNTTYSGIGFRNGSVTFKLMEVTNSTGFDSSNPSFITGSMTTVKTVTMPSSAQTSATTWKITFDQEYEYNGGDLVIDVTNATGDYQRTYFYTGTTSIAYPGYYTYSGSTGSASVAVDYVPKVTFTYESSTPPTPTPELTAPTNGSTVNVGTNEGSGVSTTITVSGNDLTENLSVSVSGTGFEVSPTSISAADANAGTTVTVTYNGTDPNATGTLTISSGEVSTTVNLTASYVQVIPTVAISPATQTINDAAAGALTVTGTNVTGNINVSAANDWSLSSTSLSNTGGHVSVSYTGRALSANTTVTASATGATDATATVNYVADLYIVTDNGVTGQWDFTSGTHMTYDPNTGSYTATFTATNDNTYILFARMLGNGVDWNTRYVFGPDSNGDWWLPADGNGNGNIDVNDDDPIKIQYGGTYTITINANDGTFTITSGGTTEVPVLITPVDGSTVFVGTTSAELPSVSKEIPISGQYLTKNLTATISGEGFSFLTRDIAVPYADVNAATASVIVTYSGTDENATGTLTLSSDEVSAVVNLTASYIKPIILTTTPAGYVVQDKKTPNQIVTAVIETTVDLYHGEVVSVTYVNSLGMTSDKPFEGVNIVITRYSDGTTSTSKVMQ